MSDATSLDWGAIPIYETEQASSRRRSPIGRWWAISWRPVAACVRRGWSRASAL